MTVFPLLDLEWLVVWVGKRWRRLTPPKLMWKFKSMLVSYLWWTDLMEIRFSVSTGWMLLRTITANLVSIFYIQSCC